MRAGLMCPRAERCGTASVGEGNRRRRGQRLGARCNPLGSVLQRHFTCTRGAQSASTSAFGPEADDDSAAGPIADRGTMPAREATR